MVTLRRDWCRYSCGQMLLIVPVTGPCPSFIHNWLLNVELSFCLHCQLRYHVLSGEMTRQEGYSNKTAPVLRIILYFSDKPIWDAYDVTQCHCQHVLDLVRCPFCSLLLDPWLPFVLQKFQRRCCQEVLLSSHVHVITVVINEAKLFHGRSWNFVPCCEFSLLRGHWHDSVLYIAHDSSVVLHRSFTANTLRLLFLITH